MSKKLLHSNTLNSQVMSSFHSSTSFAKYDGEFNSNDPRVPEEVVTLETGLRLVLDESFVDYV